MNKSIRTRWVSLLAVIAALAALVMTALILWAQSPVNRLRSSGTPTAFADLVADPIPDEQNLAAELRDLRSVLDGQPSEFVDLVRHLDGGAIPPEKLDAASSMLDEHAETADALVAAAARPTYASLLTIEQLANGLVTLRDVGPIKGAARLLSLRCRVALAEGRTEDALATALAALRIAKAVEREPFITNRLVACVAQQIAVNDVLLVIASCRLEPQDVAQLDRSLTAVEDRSSASWALESERALSIEQLAAMPLPVRFTQQNGVLRAYEQALSIAEGPFDASTAKRVRRITTASTLGSLLAPSLQSLFEIEVRVANLARDAREKLAAKQAAQ